MTDDGNETRPFPDTAMGAAFERAMAAKPTPIVDRSGIEAAMASQLKQLGRDDALSLLIEENRRLRIENGQLKSTVQAQAHVVEDIGRRCERMRQSRDSLYSELTVAKEKVARYNRDRATVGEVRVYGFAFPDMDQPLPNHFGRSMRHAKHYALVDNPTFRDEHDDDLELVECYVRIRPGAKRIRVRDFDRKPNRATDETEKA